jgi:hypothetical protein
MLPDQEQFISDCQPQTRSGNSGNLIENCQVLGGRSGFGSSGTAGSPNSDNIIRGCNIEGFGYAGIWLLGNTASTTIENNIIQQKVGYNSTIANGILTAASGTLGKTVISGNRILDIQMTATSTTASVKGIAAFANAGATFEIINNFISLPDG